MGYPSMAAALHAAALTQHSAQHQYARYVTRLFGVSK